MSLLQNAFNEVYYITVGMMHSNDGSQLEAGLLWGAVALGATALTEGISRNDKVEMGAAAEEQSLADHRFRKIGEHYMQKQWAAHQQEKIEHDEPNNG